MGLHPAAAQARPTSAAGRRPRLQGVPREHSRSASACTPPMARQADPVRVRAFVAEEGRGCPHRQRPAEAGGSRPSIHGSPRRRSPPAFHPARHPRRPRATPRRREVVRGSGLRIASQLVPVPAHRDLCDNSPTAPGHRSKALRVRQCRPETTSPPHRRPATMTQQPPHATPLPASRPQFGYRPPEHRTA